MRNPRKPRRRRRRDRGDPAADTTPRPDPIATVLGRLNEMGFAPKQSGDGWACRCPAHEDSTPSLSVRRGDDGRALVLCHAGCPFSAIVAALNLQARDLFATNIAAGSSASSRASRSTAPSAPSRDWAEDASRFAAAIGPEGPEALAEALGVRPTTLVSLGIGWATAEQLTEINGRSVRGPGWTFPMRDGRGVVVGINVRVEDGQKWTIKGGHLGLFVPAGLAELPDPVLIPEGASDTAAALTAGYTAVGRPSSTAGVQHLADMLRGRVVILCAENDRKPDGKWPGKEGATSVARQLGRIWRTEAPAIILPPDNCKDMRDWLRIQHAERGAPT